MSDIYSIFKSIVPGSIKDKEIINDIIYVFMHELIENHPVSVDVVNVFNDADFRLDFLKTYNSEIYNALRNLSKNISFFKENESYLRETNKNVLNLLTINQTKDILKNEDLMGFREFFNKKGTELGIEYIYNWINSYYNSHESSEQLKIITTSSSGSVNAIADNAGDFSKVITPGTLTYGYDILGEDSSGNKTILNNLKTTVAITGKITSGLADVEVSITDGIEKFTTTTDSLGSFTFNLVFNSRLKNKLTFINKNTKDVIITTTISGKTEPYAQITIYSESDDKVPFEIEYTGGLPKVVFDYFVRTIAQPLGFLYTYSKVTTYDLENDYYCGKQGASLERLELQVRSKVNRVDSFVIDFLHGVDITSENKLVNNSSNVKLKEKGAQDIYGVDVTTSGSNTTVSGKTLKNARVSISSAGYLNEVTSNATTGAFSFVIPNMTNDEYTITAYDQNNASIQPFIVTKTFNSFQIKELTLTSDGMYQTFTGISKPGATVKMTKLDGTLIKTTTANSSGYFALVVDIIGLGELVLLSSYTATKQSTIVKIFGGIKVGINDSYFSDIERYSSDSEYTDIYNLSNNRFICTTTKRTTLHTIFRYFDADGTILYEINDKDKEITIDQIYDTSNRGKMRCVSDANLLLAEYMDFYEQYFPSSPVIDTNNHTVIDLDESDVMTDHRPIQLDYHHKQVSNLTPYNNDITGYPVIQAYTPDPDHPENGYIENGIFNGYDTDILKLENEPPNSPYLRFNNFDRTHANGANAFQNRNYPSLSEAFWYSVPSTSTEDYEKFFPIHENVAVIFGETGNYFSDSLYMGQAVPSSQPFATNGEVIYNTEHNGYWWRNFHQWKFIGQHYYYDAPSGDPTPRVTIGSVKIGTGIRKLKLLDISESGTNYKGIPGFVYDYIPNAHSHYHSHLGDIQYFDDNLSQVGSGQVNVGNSLGQHYFRPLNLTSNFEQDERTAYNTYKQSILDGYSIDYFEDSGVYYFETPKRRISNVTGDVYGQSFTFYHAIPPRQQEFNNMYFKPSVAQSDPVNLQYYTVEYFDIEVIRD